MSVVRQLWNFFLGSGIGVTIDLVVFAVLSLAGVPAVIANTVSSALAVTATYFFVTRYAFGSRSSRLSYVLFCAWYALSIVGFSFLIEWMVGTTGLLAIVCKLISLPFSFGVNFVFSRFLFAWVQGRTPEAAVIGIDDRKPGAVE